MWDTDGDGIWDIGYDPLTGEHFYITRIPKPGGGGTPVDQRHAMNMNSLGDEGPVDSDPPEPEPEEDEYVYVIDGCVLDVSALAWNADTGEEFIQNHGLDIGNGTQSTLGNLAVCHSFDTDGEADLTLFWSSDHAVVRPTDFDLCYKINDLPNTSSTGPDGMQIRVRGEWHDVARWVVAMGTNEFSIPVDGVTWTMTAVAGGTAIDVKINGVYAQTVSLN
ncbi:MAG: hypothetical protein U0573_10615 [Phycisphaerales bacterium]|nr:hypothetical protein [Planctomycetota bacterium]